MKIRTEKGQMVALIDAYDHIWEIEDGMKPLFGVQCGEGLLQKTKDLIVRLIEYNSEQRGMKLDSDEWCDFLYSTLDNGTSSGNRAEILLNEHEIEL